MNQLAGKIALVTGSASGIGEACARRFAAEAATVIAAGRPLVAPPAIHANPYIPWPPLERRRI